jgi:hypothetical protein
MAEIVIPSAVEQAISRVLVTDLGMGPVLPTADEVADTVNGRQYTVRDVWHRNASYSIWYCLLIYIDRLKFQDNPKQPVAIVKFVRWIYIGGIKLMTSCLENTKCRSPLADHICVPPHLARANTTNLRGSERWHTRWFEISISYVNHRITFPIFFSPSLTSNSSFGRVWCWLIWILIHYLCKQANSWKKIRILCFVSHPVNDDDPDIRNNRAEIFWILLCLILIMYWYLILQSSTICIPCLIYCFSFI